MKINLTLQSFSQLSLGETIIKLENDFEMFHIDIMDVKYCNNMFQNFEIYKELNDKFPNKKLEIHIMSTEDDQLIKKLSELKNIFSVSIHVRNKSDEQINKSIELMKDLNIKPGLAIELDDDVSEYKSLIEKVEVVTFMSVLSGQAGQVFNENVFENISKVNKKNKTFIIDGGIRKNHTEKLELAGIDYAVGGGYFK